MKSILIEKPNQLAIVEREIPTPSAGEVRVKVKLAGICGSDSHIYRGHNPFASLMQWVKAWKAPESVNVLLSIRWSAVGIAIRAL
ncbi:alcohol dehydrogenase GroES-like domain protein [Escherichia coli 2875150]|nr:alcohol dehydrogenase GroES-like domain protein [Escherichia coli 2875150]